ncbi:MAG TPA: helix-turn-helix domain-containing protein [Clostridia bacterium]|nr:helix-turn-helix domain-containing protein [Clostridia bacterium]
MADMRILLEQAAEITNKRIAVIMQNESIVYPEGSALGITYEEACKEAGKNYKGCNIYRLDVGGNKHFVCISSDKYYESETTNLVMLLLGAATESDGSTATFLKKAVEGKYDEAELAKLEENLKSYLPGYMLLVDDFGDYKNEVLEILINTMDIRARLEYGNRIIAVANEENIIEACSSFVKNVLSELLIECKVVLGGSAVCAKELQGMYGNCIEALCLKQIYGLGDSVLDYEGMYGYRIAHNLDPKLKEFISRRVFTPEFKEMLNGELGITIEEFFKNNLNLTDTAAKLYIHRNTLLYRLDKINKSTGFDIKKFEDSWLFKLAWMIHKEKRKE